MQEGTIVKGGCGVSPLVAVDGAWAGVMMIVLCCTSFTACVERKMLIHTDPPGAIVLIDEEERGETPLEIPFTFSRSRLIELRKEGFESERFMEDVNAPFYQIFPLDFFFAIFILLKVVR